jgi:predicted transposase YbfD/YdcC
MWVKKMTFPKKTSKQCPVFKKYFSDLQDPRRINKGHYYYPLDELLFLTIAAIISGMDNWTSISNFGKLKIDWLRIYFPFENGTPSHDVLGKVFAQIDANKFSECFSNWINELSEITKGEVVAIDGKTIRKSNDKNLDKRPFHVVSAYATENRVCLGQQCVDEKSNEITAIPQLLELLVIKDCIITIDAMGCQKAIAKKIIEKDAHYVLMVKDNQKTLKNDIEATFSLETPVQSSKKQDIGHGRIETRICEVTDNLTLVKSENKWKGFKTIVKISSERIDKHSKKSSTEIRYYMSSLLADANHLNDIIRKHWSIENNLHWVLDVVFNEDYSLKKKGQSALNYNIMTKVALCLIEKEKSLKRSKIIKRQSAALNDNYRAKVLKI